MIHLRKGYKAWCKCDDEHFITLTDDPETANCQECLELEKVDRIEQAKVKPPMPSRLERWASFGEQDFYEELQWIVLGVMTCGLGIPVMMVLKAFAKSRLKK